MKPNFLNQGHYESEFLSINCSLSLSTLECEASLNFDNAILWIGKRYKAYLQAIDMRSCTKFEINDFFESDQVTHLKNMQG